MFERIKRLFCEKCLCQTCCHFGKECIGYCGKNPVVTCDLYNKSLKEVETDEVKLPHINHESEE